jgi:hypothetical protein
MIVTFVTVNVIELLLLLSTNGASPIKLDFFYDISIVMLIYYTLSITDIRNIISKKNLQWVD